MVAVHHGRQGRAPEPPWDPLAFAVDAAHKRGLELHAWFNPYRAAYVRDTALATTHIARAQPELVRPYGRFLWMDPGSAEVRRRTIRAIVDVVKRYDIDGVHIDDYFYPYPETDAAGHTIDFPDADTYARYKKAGGSLAKDDWRRANVDSMVAALYRGVHAVKPWVRVGISPFGIWRPGNPPQIRGLDAYATIYADSKLWLEKGWADYFAPQLYWQIRPAEQSFPVLLDWWLSQNSKHRHIWPGLADYRIGEAGANGSRFTSQEIVDQIDTIRARDKGEAGHIHFNMTALMKDPDSLAEKVASLYREPALVPASPWLGSKPPARPTATVARDPETGDLMLRMTARRGGLARVALDRSFALQGRLDERGAAGVAQNASPSRRGDDARDPHGGEPHGRGERRGRCGRWNEISHRSENGAGRPIGELRRVVPRVDWSTDDRSSGRRTTVVRRQSTAWPRVA